MTNHFNLKIICETEISRLPVMFFSHFTRLKFILEQKRQSILQVPLMAWRREKVPFPQAWPSRPQLTGGRHKHGRL